MKTLRQKIESKLKSTFAWDLLGESGSPEEGREELILAVFDIVYQELMVTTIKVENAVLKADPNAKG